MTLRNVEGIIPVLVTPFDESEAILEADVARQIDAAVAFGIGTVCLPAYGSEFYKLSEQERVHLVEVAVKHANGRIQIAAQSNHLGAKMACEIARRNQNAGADPIVFAMPRLYPASNEVLLDYCRRICETVPELTVMIQDVYPGGVTVGAEFCRELAKACPNFKYLKLEETMMLPKIRAINEATNGHVSLLEGWGGMYMPEMAREPGCVGCMPGLAMADLLKYVWDNMRCGNTDDALDAFGDAVTQLTFALQHFELWLTLEKELHQRRGIISTTKLRSPGISPCKTLMKHGLELNKRVIRRIESLGLKAQPLGS